MSDMISYLTGCAQCLKALKPSLFSLGHSLSDGMSEGTIAQLLCYLGTLSPQARSTVTSACPSHLSARCDMTRALDSRKSMVLVVTSCYRGRNGVCETRTPFRLAHVIHFPHAYWAPLATLATSQSRPGPIPTCIILRVPVGSVAICSDAENTFTEDTFFAHLNATTCHKSETSSHMATTFMADATRDAILLSLGERRHSPRSHASRPWSIADTV